MRFLFWVFATEIIPSLWKKAPRQGEATPAVRLSREGGKPLRLSADKRAKVQAEKNAAETAKEWRKVRWIMLAVVSVLILAGLFLTGVLPLRAKLTPADHALLAHYETLRHALANERLEEARSVAHAITKLADAKPSISAHAHAVAQSVSLEMARQDFVPLSETIVALARGRPGYFVMHCPIQGCPEPCENCPMDRYSPWIQTSREVENPYMGLKHIKCGIVSRDQSAR